MAANRQTASERIRAWVEREFNPAHVDRVTTELIDIAAGNRPGNQFCHAALAKIFPDWQPTGEDAGVIRTWVKSYDRFGRLSEVMSAGTIAQARARYKALCSADDCPIFAQWGAQTTGGNIVLGEYRPS